MNVIFDIGGVLLDFKYKEYLQKKYNNKKLEEEIVSKTLNSNLWSLLDKGSIRLDTLVNILANENPMIANDIIEFIEDIPAMVSENIEGVKLIQELKRKGHKIYLLSNFGYEHFIKLVQDSLFYKLIDGEIISYQVHMLKPDREIYEYLLESYKLNRNDSIFIDDRMDNIMGAKNVSLNGLLFSGYDDLISKLRKLELI